MCYLEVVEAEVGTAWVGLGSPLAVWGGGGWFPALHPVPLCPLAALLYNVGNWGVPTARGDGLGEFGNREEGVGEFVALTRLFLCHFSYHMRSDL